MNIAKKLFTATATGALLLNLATPAFADTIQISGNGSDSTNTAVTTTTSTNTAVQTNTASVTNVVNADSNTGFNDASGNTGGSVVLSTGDANTTVKADNLLNANKAELGCCNSGPTDVLISGNGSGSDNTAVVTKENTNNVFQTNAAEVVNDVNTSSNTGFNSAGDNTGGSVLLKTGDINTKVKLNTMANANIASIGGGGSAGGTGGVSAKILGNGSDSDNVITLAFDNTNMVDQTNSAFILNDVNTSSNTGFNDASDNTGGAVMMLTGDINNDVKVDNAVNFNVADLNCGCLVGDLSAKIAGNGSESDNVIVAALDSDNSAFQTNGALLLNEVCGEGGIPEVGPLQIEGVCGSNTGFNSSSDNTGAVSGLSDPTLITGDIDNAVHLNNEGNVNILGNNSSDFHIPGLSFDFNLSELSMLLAMMSMH